MDGKNFFYGDWYEPFRELVGMEMTFLDTAEIYVPMLPSAFYEKMSYLCTYFLCTQVAV